MCIFQFWHVLQTALAHPEKAIKEIVRSCYIMFVGWLVKLCRMFFEIQLHSAIFQTGASLCNWRRQATALLSSTTHSYGHTPQWVAGKLKFFGFKGQANLSMIGCRVVDLSIALDVLRNNTAPSEGCNQCLQTFLIINCNCLWALRSIERQSHLSTPCQCHSWHLLKAHNLNPWAYFPKSSIL